MISQNQKDDDSNYCEKLESEYSEIFKGDEKNVLYRRKRSVTYNNLIRNDLIANIKPFKNIAEGKLILALASNEIFKINLLKFREKSFWLTQD